MKKTEKIIIFGNGPFAEIVHYYLKNDSKYEVVAFTADEDFISENKFQNLPVIPFDKIENKFPPMEYKMFIGIGYMKINKIRADRYVQAKKKGYSFISYINSKSVISKNVKIGENCFILENQTIQPFVEIGNNVIIWSGNHIGHHSQIQDHCFIASHVVISGHVKIGKYSFLGVNSTMRDGITIAPRCVIGAGALILENTLEKGVYSSEKAKKLSITSDKLKEI